MKKKRPARLVLICVKIMRRHENDRRSAAFHAPRVIGLSQSTVADNKGNGHMSDSETTTDHDAIKKWAEERDGHPATVRATEEDGHAGILRIDFGPTEDRLEVIDWDEFFRKFDESDLAFLHQDRTKDGKLSRFHKFVRRSAA
jgi:hypothetical protein